jgi:hypothetical protein
MAITCLQSTHDTLFAVQQVGMEAAVKKTMTLNLTDAEMRVLDDLSSRKDLSKTAVLRQALRLYQAIELRVEKGDKLVFENENTREKAELMLL